MKFLFPISIGIVLLGVLFATPSFVSCTKETTIHDTTIVSHHDTTVIYKHDTTQLTLESCCNSNEGYVNSYFSTSNGNGVNQITIAAWTHSGSPENSRTFMKFDYSDIPANAIIISAKLSLYAIPTPGSGNLVDAHFGTANACYIQRITSAYSIATINWTDQPTFTTQNQVTIPQSASSFEDNTNLDVSNLVKDMLADGNNGFFIQLQNETTFNSRQYCSSYYADKTKRPTLVIQYKNQ